MSKPKELFRTRLDDGKILSVAVFPTKKNPAAEVISVNVQKFEEQTWKNFGRIAIYRSPEGNYNLLPDRERQSE
jgi:hypothetical protein